MQKQETSVEISNKKKKHKLREGERKELLQLAAIHMLLLALL